MKKIVIVTSTRAEYGLLRPVIFKLKSVTEFDVKIVVTGMHLSSAFGNTYMEIEHDGFCIDKKIEMLTGLRNKIEEINPVFRPNIINNLILLKRTPKNISSLLTNVEGYSPQFRDILNIKNTLNIQWIEESKKQAREALDLQAKDLRRVLCV